jgi:acetyltransferase-like isoleucine patch superfamily enzyme
MPGYRIRCMMLKMAGYRIGRNVFIGEELIIKDELEDRRMVAIGDRVAIADRVTLVVSSHPNFSRIREVMGEVHEPINIGDDAWIGTGVIVFPGVRIGKGAVVGAGSVVTSDVPDSTIVVGNPARTLRIIDLPGGETPSKKTVRLRSTRSGKQGI